MTAPGATIEDIADASATPREDLIQAVLDRITSEEDRTSFLRGLTTRMLALREHRDDDDVNELHRWIGSWFVSLEVLASKRFEATDAEVTKLLDAGKLGEGITGKQLRDRFSR